MVVGILAFQGDVAEHRSILTQLELSARDVRTLHELAEVTHLIIPGGESTVIGLHMKFTGLDTRITERVREGSLFVLGTCAGLILLARLGLLHATVERNAYGSQIDSFDAAINVRGIDAQMYAAFIRAPKISHVDGSVEILAECDWIPVVVREGNILASTCHPELRGESLLHEMFLGLR